MNMPTSRHLAAIGLAMVITLSGCAGMNRSDRATATGAAIGGVAGAVITNSTVGAAAGAVVGGVVGNQLEKKKDK